MAGMAPPLDLRRGAGHRNSRRPGSGAAWTSSKSPCSPGIAKVKPITDLTRDEIAVLENGTPQALVAIEKGLVPGPGGDVTPERAAVQVPLDVASNESLAPSRVFVLVLDSHHVSATRARTVKPSPGSSSKTTSAPMITPGCFARRAAGGDARTSPPTRRACSPRSTSSPA